MSEAKKAVDGIVTFGQLAGIIASPHPPPPPQHSLSASFAGIAESCWKH